MTTTTPRFVVLVVLAALLMGMALAMATGHLHYYSSPTPTIVLDHTAIQFGSNFGPVAIYYWE